MRIDILIFGGIHSNSNSDDLSTYQNGHISMNNIVLALLHNDQGYSNQKAVLYGK
jgi:hypothetical protein